MKELRPLAALAVVALLSAACSNAAAQTGDSTVSNRAQAMKFVECMRKNGVRDFPDPDAAGALTIDQVANGTSLDTNSAAFRQASTTCRDLQPAGFTGTMRSPEQQQAALKYAQCIRENGVRDFPDPEPDGPLVDTTRIPSAAGRGGRDIPGLRQAMEKCGAVYSGELGLQRR